jgi:hypothetical protein
MLFLWLGSVLDREPYTCPVCHRWIVDDGFGNSPGDHDPAYHVAQAYHYQVPAKMMRVQVCASCGKTWPCPTIQEYS